MSSLMITLPQKSNGGGSQMQRCRFLAQASSQPTSEELGKGELVGGGNACHTSEWRGTETENPTQLFSPTALSLVKRTPLLSPPCCPLHSCNPTGKSSGDSKRLEMPNKPCWSQLWPTAWHPKPQKTSSTVPLTAWVSLRHRRAHSLTQTGTFTIQRRLSGLNASVAICLHSGKIIFANDRAITKVVIPLNICKIGLEVTCVLVD